MSGRIEPSKRVKKDEVLPGSIKDDIGLADPVDGNVAKIKAEYRKKDPKPSNPGHQIGNASELRKHILSMSLFPNIYSFKMIHRESGPE